MSLLQRASRLLKANINHLLDSAEDPEVMLKQLVHDMEEALVELRRETVNAVAREKQLARKAKAAEQIAADLEQDASLALDHDNEEMARKILLRRTEVVRREESLNAELERATALAKRVKSDLIRMQEQVETARGKKEELVRRKRAAEATLRTEEAARRSTEAMSDAGGKFAVLRGGAPSVDGYDDAIDEIEARAEAARELTEESEGDDVDLRKLRQSSEVDEQLERLKRRRQASS